MRTSKLTSEEIQEAEKASEARRQSRNLGFAKMYERDMAIKELSNGVTMKWHVNKELGKRIFIDTENNNREIIVYPPNIPEDSFVLTIDKKDYLFNLDEFRRWLRWA